MEETDREINLNPNAQNCSNTTGVGYVASMGRFFQRPSAFDCMHPSGGGVGVGVGLPTPHHHPSTFPGYSSYPPDWGFMSGTYSSGFNFNRTFNNHSSSNIFSRDFSVGLPSASSVPPPLIGSSPTSGVLPCEAGDSYESGPGGSSCSPSPDHCLGDDSERKENKHRGMFLKFTQMYFVY